MKISGRVIRENGQPAAAGVTIAYSYPGSGGVFTYGMRSVRTAADGTFEIKDVPGGSYSVWSSGDDRHLTVADADIDDVVLVLRTGSTCLARSSPRIACRPRFHRPGCVSSPTRRSTGAAARPGEIGRERLVLQVRGTRRPVSLSNDGTSGRLARIRYVWATRTSPTRPGMCRRAARRSGLTIVVTQAMASVSGAVADARGKPAAAATVLVFSEDPEHWIPYSRLIRVARPTADGRFSVTGLPAGTYRAVARLVVEEGQWEDRSVLESLPDEAVRIVLAEGGSETLTLKVSDAR